jgi:hypothetical protein
MKRAYPLLGLKSVGGRGQAVTIEDLVARVPGFVNELSMALEQGAGLAEIEARVVEFVNQIGSLIMQELVEQVREPVQDNRVWVAGEEAVFDGYRNLRFRNRFGQITQKRRRCYRYVGKPGGYYPLDERLGLDKCGGFSPLMSLLQSMFGSSRPFGESSRLLSCALGFAVSSTAVQWNTEHTGALLSDEPHRSIPQDRRGGDWQRMIVQMDSTTSPQIHQEQGITGRKALEQPTEWKQCHIGIIQRFRRGRLRDEWTVARYGTLEAFGLHLGRTALQLGLEGTRQIVFLSDGLAANWQICLDHFPDALQILDFYHASEHLTAFCSLHQDGSKGDSRFKRWCPMLLDGEGSAG